MNSKINIGKIKAFMYCRLSKEPEVEETEEEKKLKKISKILNERLIERYRQEYLNNLYKKLG
ncbi:MAG: hypothetical protein J6A52_04930 [Bacilli bacterium]|nr:hypothetical protein [Bacilli bacterium]